MRALAELCRRRDILLISDEVYRAFCYDRPFASPATWNEDVLVVDGFSKSHGMTGWRLGFAHGPTPPDPGDGQAPAVQLRLRPEHGPVRRRRRPRPGPDRRRSTPIAASATWSSPPSATTSSWPAPKAPSTPSPAPLGHRHRVRRRGDPAQPADHPRQRLPPPRHPLPDLVRRRRRDPRAAGSTSCASSRVARPADLHTDGEPLGGRGEPLEPRLRRGLVAGSSRMPSDRELRRFPSSARARHAECELPSGTGGVSKRLFSLRTTSAVTTNLPLSLAARSGSSNMMSSMTSSTIERRPRAPVSLALAILAISMQGVGGELEVGAFHLEELAVLLDQGVARLGQDLDQRVDVERHRAGR